MKRLIGLLLFGFLIGCGSATPPAAEPPKPAAVAGSGQAPASPVKAGLSEVDRAAVERLVVAWAEAQNRSDFDAYQAMYADTFFGIKRAGSRVRQFGLKGWLEDRGKMFRRPFTVTVSGLVIGGTPDLAIANFTQEWQSAKFRDVGPKQLVLERRGSSWAIRREELFSSTLLDAASLPHLDEAQFRFVWWTDRPYLLLTQQLPPNLKLASPRADVDPATSELRVVEAVAADSVPEAQRGAAAGSYDLFAADGKRCTAKAAGFVRIGIVQGYLTYEEMPKVAGPVDANEYGQFVTDNARWLALELTAAPGSSCARDAFWGRDAALPAVTVSAGAKSMAPVAFDAALRQTKAWQGLQGEYASWDREEGDTTTPLRTGRWDEGRAEAFVRFSSTGVAPFAWHLAVGGTGCADFLGELWTIWRDEQPAPVRWTADDTLARPQPPSSAVDLDGDGKLELVGPDILYQQAGPIWRIGRTATRPWVGCGC